MKRREFIAAGTGAVPVALMGKSHTSSIHVPQRRSNILWIMTDQQPPDALSCADNPDLQTPSMDRLAANGVRFERLIAPIRSASRRGQR